MKKKINTYLLFTVFLTLLATLGMAVAIFHYMYRKQVVADMQTYAELLSDMAATGEELKERYTDTVPELRVTVIGRDGTVVYDSKAAGEPLENHADRPEVQEAEAEGEAYAVRHSDTFDSDMYYYAVQLGDGDILRISKEAASIWHVFTRTITGIAAIALVMLGVCLVLSRYITASLVRPIEKLAEDIDRADGIDTYEELVPFITMIRRQHMDIIKNAKMRQEFTANVSHELKTPLTSISGYAELIGTGFAGENEVRHFAKEIHRSAQRLLTLINDIIRLSELESGQAETPCMEVDLYDIARNCVGMLQINAKSHGIRMVCHGSESMIHADKGMMEELVYNLCDNAIRYNRPGGCVDVTVTADGSGTRLSVRDTGIGIPKESQECVFERFYRVDKSRSKQTGGTGLGLAIVKHIVAQHHAQLELVSECGKGTEITVLFPW